MKTTAKRKTSAAAADPLNVPAAFEEAGNAIKAANAAACLLFELQFGELVHYRPAPGQVDPEEEWDNLFEMAAHTITHRLPKALETLKRIEAATLAKAAAPAGGVR